MSETGRNVRHLIVWMIWLAWLTLSVLALPSVLGGLLLGGSTLLWLVGVGYLRSVDQIRDNTRDPLEV